MQAIDFHEITGVSRGVFEGFVSDYENHLAQKMGRPNLLKPNEEMLLFFIWFRQNPVDALIAGMFQISRRRVGDIRQRMRLFMYNRLKDELSLQTPSWRRVNGVNIFDSLYTFIIDGCEQPIVGANNSFVDTEYYSSKKGYPTVSKMMMVSPNGRILYLSPSFPGSWKDDDIACKTLQEWYAPLEDDEYGLGDAGYDGLDDFTRVRTPPPKKKEFRHFWRVFASVRVIIEQKFRLIKIFHATKETLRVGPHNTRTELLKNHDMSWTIAAVIVNDYSS
jgi:hypothetical protein